MNQRVRVDALWHAARRQWSLAVELKRPLQTRKPGAIAYIDLQTRQTWIDFKWLRKQGLEACTEALCAHEVGHHIRYPNTLVEAYRQTRFLREELTDLLALWGQPGRVAAVREGQWDFLLNLLFDLLINTDLRPHYQDEFIALYQGLAVASDATPDGVFGWYLGLYEEGWYLPPGTLVDPKTDALLEALRPGWRLAAGAAFRHLRANGSNRYLQVTRFLFDLGPLLPASAPEAGKRGALEGGRPFGGKLGADEARRVMQGSAAESAARRWRQGEVTPVADPKKKGGKPSKPSGAGGPSGRPGVGEGDPIRTLQDVMKGLCEPVEVALDAYRRLARQAGLEVPRSRVPGSSDTLGPTEPWDFGDRLDEIDWQATLSRSGQPIPGLNLEKRMWLEEEPQAGDRLTPWIELYVDCSGSMPDPVQNFNYSILAGFILADAALQAGGRVRVISYSHEHRAMPDFVMSERLAQAGLLTYVGGGTRFPWDVLHESDVRWRRVAAVHRVVISDSDFLYNFTQPDVVLPGYTPPQLVSAALNGATRPPGSLILLLQVPAQAAELKRLRAAGARVLTVGGWGDLPAVARDLVKALWPPSETG